MKHIKTILSLFVIGYLAPALPAGGFVITPKAFAECTTQYGGSSGCTPSDLFINKQVKNPITGLFVENLSTTDATFSPGSEIVYRLTIRNGSGETFDPVTVKDTFPSYVIFSGGPGSYDAPSRTLTFNLDKLIAGQSRTVEIVAKVEPKSAFPAGKSFFCVVNSARASASARPEGAEDSAQACLQTEVLGAKTLPVAGFNDLLLVLPFAGIGLGGIALLLKKK